MKRKYTLISIILLVALIIFGGRAMAQFFLASTEPGGEATAVTIKPSYVSGDPDYQDMLPPDDNSALGGNSADVKYDYFTVSGATLRGRSSVTEYTYVGSGCSYTTVGTDTERILNTELLLPEHAIIKYLRAYYNDTNPKSGVDGYLTRITPGKGKDGVVDLTAAVAPDAYNSGFGFTVSPEITETVNNELYAYTLIAYPDENNIANQICGLRVAYFPPYNGVVFLPSIHR